MQSLLEQRISNFTNAIKKSLENKNWYSALTIALTLPDIIGRLEYPKDQSKERYIRWFDEYLLEKYTRKNQWGKHVFLSGRDAYALRCAFLHQGETNIETQKAREALNKFLFIIPLGGTVHCNQNEEELQLQVDIYCMDIHDAVLLWIEQFKGDNVIEERAKNIMEIHTNLD